MTTVAWAGTDQQGLLWYTTLDIIGRVEQRIQLFDPKVEWDSLDFRIVDTTSDTLVGTVCRESHSTANKTWLTADLTNSATSASVQSTAGFGSTGTLYIGNESIPYTGKTATTFTGLTRGYMSLFATNGGARFSDQHYLSTDGAAFAPEVWDQPRTWYNRRCALYLHYIDPDTGKPCTKANAQLVWVGRLKGAPKDNGDGSVTFTAWSIREQLNRTLMDEQFTADLTSGHYVLATRTKMRLRSTKSVSSPVSFAEKHPAAVQLFSASAYHSYDEYLTEIDEAISAAITAGDIHGASGGAAMMPVGPDGSYLASIGFSVTSATDTYTFQVGLDPLVWELLGWPFHHAASSDGLVYRSMERISSPATRYRLEAPEAPLAYQFRVQPNDVIGIDSATIHGQWNDQLAMPPGLSTDPVGGTANGFIQIGGLGVFAVTKSGNTFRVVKEVTDELAALGQAASDVGGAVMRGARVGSPVSLKQIWIEYGQVGELMLKLACSTGTSSYNHAGYDTHPRSFGAAIPYSLIDTWGWYFLGAATHWLVLTKPRPLLEELESALRVRGAYLVWRAGKLTIRRLAEPAAGEADWALTESNKANTSETNPDRTLIERSAQGLVNRVTLDYSADINDEFREHITINNNASISDFGAARPVTFKGRGVYKNGFMGPALGAVGDWLSTAAGMLAHFGRPIAIGRRSIDFSLSEVVPTDTVELTDNYVVSPLTGARGIDAWPGYVLEQSFDFSPGQCRGEVVFAMLPETTPNRLAAWAPCAEVASSTVTGGKLVITCTAHKYSLATEATDATRFPAYSGILVAEISSTDPASPTTYALTVDSQTGNTITCTTDPTAGVGLATTKVWAVQFDDIANVLAAQKSKAFIADDYDSTTGDSTYTHYRWMGPVTSLGTSTTIDYQQVYRKLANYEDNKGEPLSCRLAADTAHAVNALYGYKTCNQYVGEMFATQLTHNTTTRKLLWGPEWIDLPSEGARDLVVWLLCKTSAGTATLRVVASTQPATGSSDTALTYADGGAKYVEVTQTGTALDWKSATLTDPWRTANGCWLTVEGSATTNDTVTLAALSVYEAHL
ncbi:MAG: hypothetical protein AAB706_02835 [Patescibacteria group bacterium]